MNIVYDVKKLQRKKLERKIINKTLHTLPRLSEISEKIWSTYLGKVIFDIPFLIQSHAESMKKNPVSHLGSTM